jgi:hypothetical protein
MCPKAKDFYRQILIESHSATAETAFAVNSNKYGIVYTVYLLIPTGNSNASQQFSVPPGRNYNWVRSEFLL